MGKDCGTSGGGRGSQDLGLERWHVTSCPVLGELKQRTGGLGTCSICIEGSLEEPSGQKLMAGEGGRRSSEELVSKSEADEISHCAVSL